MCSQWYCALNENCHFANMTTVENKHCTHHLKQCGTKCKKKILHLWDVPPLRYFPMPVHFVSSWTTGLFWTPVNIERQISVFLLFLLKFSVLTHFPKPSVVYTVSLIHWMFRFWASSSLLPGRIGKIMVYFVLASENWKLSDEERGKKACWLCVFWCVNPRLGRTTRGGCPPARPPPPPPFPPSLTRKHQHLPISVTRRWSSHFEWKCMFFQLFSILRAKLANKIMQSAYLCVILLVKYKKLPFLGILTWFLILGKIQVGGL